MTWIKANVNASGYYRVNYEPAIWTSLIRVLTTQPTAFSPADRAQLIDDAFTLAWYLILFNFLSFFKTEVLIVNNQIVNCNVLVLCFAQGGSIEHNRTVDIESVFGE